MGWYGSEPLTELLSQTPCGCDLRDRAEREADPRARKIFTRDASRWQREWGCPHGDRRGEPSEACRKTLPQVCRLVGAEGDAITTCPGLLVRRPEAAQAMAAWRWWEQGQLAVRLPFPSAALVEAIDLVDLGLKAREAEELRRIKQRKRGGGDG